jgi:hypothetical protein
MPKPTELPTLTFESKKKFADRLAKNHDRVDLSSFEEYYDINQIH